MRNQARKKINGRSVHHAPDVEKQELQSFKRKTRHRAITKEQEGMKKYPQTYEQFQCKLWWG